MPAWGELADEVATGAYAIGSGRINLAATDSASIVVRFVPAQRVTPKAGPMNPSTVQPLRMSFETIAADFPPSYRRDGFEGTACSGLFF